MGKKLVIKGADFSVNGIAPEYEFMEKLNVLASSTPVYFDIAETSNPKFVCCYQCTDVNAGKVDFFYLNGNQTKRHALQVYSDKLAYCYLGENNISSGKSVLSNEDIVLEMGNGIATINGTDVRNGKAFSGVTLNRIYAIGSDQPASKPLTGREVFKYMKVYDASTNTLLLDLVPAKRLKDGAFGVYDNISGEFHRI